MFGEAFEHDLVVAPPRDEAERAGPDRVARERRAALLGLLARHDRRRIVGHQVDEGRERPVQRDLHRVLVDRPDARDVCRLAPDERRGAPDFLEHPRPLAPGGALERVLDVARHELAPGLELHAAPEMKGVHAVIGRQGPAPR